MDFLLGTIFVIACFLVFLAFKKRKSSALPEIVLYGPSGSGKTALFYLMTEESMLPTVASLKPNSGQIKLGNKIVKITDYPGHKYYYGQLINNLPQCLGMIFILDSTDKLAFKKAAEELYELMALRQPKELLIFCNKQDLPFAKKIMMIESELSTEIERLKIVKENDIADVKREKVGTPGLRFEFSQMAEVGVKVEFAEGSLKTRDLKAIENFIDRVGK